LNIPVWNWGATRSKIRQAALKQQQAQLDLTVAQRTLQGNIDTAFREAQTALAQVNSLRASVDLSTESLRLTILRYEAGEATALEVSTPNPLSARPATPMTMVLCATKWP